MPPGRGGGGGRIPHAGGGRGGDSAHDMKARGPPSLARPPPPLSAQPRRLQHHGQLRSRRRGGRLCPRRGGSFTCTVCPRPPQHPGDTYPIPPGPSRPGSPVPFFSPLSSRENVSRSLRSSAASPPSPSRRREGHTHTETPPPPPLRSSPPSRCHGAQPPAGVGRGGGERPDLEQGGSRQRLRGAGGRGRGKARRMRGVGGVEGSGSPSPPPPLGAQPLPPPAPGARYLPNGPG